MSTAILWFRDDLRLADNPALHAAGKHDRLLPVYIRDLPSHGGWPPGAASDWWLHHSLSALDEALNRLGSRLLLREGASLEVLAALVRETGATAVFWNRRYAPDCVAVDRAVKAGLTGMGCRVQSFNASLLFEPWEIQRGGGGPYRVFTPFWKACLARGGIDPGWPAPGSLPPPPAVDGEALETLALLPAIPWADGLAATWRPGEQGAQAGLDRFLAGALGGYCDDRDIPAREGTARLSAHLHFGEISPRQIVTAVNAVKSASAECFVRQLGWREFAHHLLFHFPHTDSSPLNEQFAAFPWRTDYAADLKAWQQGNTGIPLVDAGMRELWRTGWMHNRVRMVVASFLTKNLLIPRQEGARWFWDPLVDADLANNSLGWQWVAGSGADAAPYFRIFNPVLQGERFDPNADYVRQWLPELSGLPLRHVHQPWKAPAAALSALPADSPYRDPIVDLRMSRLRALDAYAQMR